MHFAIEVVDRTFSCWSEICRGLTHRSHSLYKITLLDLIVLFKSALYFGFMKINFIALKISQGYLFWSKIRSLRDTNSCNDLSKNLYTGRFV